MAILHSTERNAEKDKTVLHPFVHVSVRGKESGEAMLMHGVPQDSIVGPLFFILFINDLPLHVSADVDLYADDTTVTASADVKNLAHLDLSLNKSVREIQA